MGGKIRLGGRAASSLHDGSCRPLRNQWAMQTPRLPCHQLQGWRQELRENHSREYNKRVNRCCGLPDTQLNCEALKPGGTGSEDEFSATGVR